MATLLQKVVNHVALPPKLPFKADENENIENVNEELVSKLLRATHVVSDAKNRDFLPLWESTQRILQKCKELNTGGKLSKSSLVDAFNGLKPNDLLILHVAEQNSGMLIHRKSHNENDQVIIEAFEASALSEKVLATQNALRWTFPGSAVAVSYAKLGTLSFQNAFASFLEQASVEPIKRFAAHSNKARSSVFESRETADPAIITELLMTLLEVHGERVPPSLIQKRVREDVCWGTGAENPWRRSPFWLVIRVGLIRHFHTLHGPTIGTLCYKILLCQLLAALVAEGVNQLGFDVLRFLNAKLARRLTKLEDALCQTSSSDSIFCAKIFKNLERGFLKTLEKSNDTINMHWDSFKSRHQKCIDLLPRRAHESYLKLTLLQSQKYLEKVLSWYPDHTRPDSLTPPTTLQFQKFASFYRDLASLEQDIELNIELLSSSDPPPENPILQCEALTDRLTNYLKKILDTSRNDAEQKSIMILNVMNLWMLIDKCATMAFPLLLDYDPGIPAAILDVLLLMHYKDFVRLREIQFYLRGRTTACKHGKMTIFGDPARGSFAEQYYDHFSESTELLRIREKIETKAKNAKDRKFEEWKNASDEHRSLQQEIQGLSCVYIIEDDCKVHDDKRCRKCFLRRRAKRMRIDIHEHPLPTDPVHLKAVIFELGAPKAFRRYRDVTWQIIGTLMSQRLMTGPLPPLVLKDYSELPGLCRSKMDGISLASTKKSFLDTHYSRARFPVEFDQVCLPNPLCLSYFDPSTRVWTSQQRDAPSVAHHLPISIPTSSPFAQLGDSLGPRVASKGPTSYEIMASQTKCPAGLNSHEYMAYQSLASGRYRRWLNILTELGSSNLNFSMASITALVSYLAMQAGPGRKSDPLGAIHGSLLDDQFCRQLMKQIKIRLKTISLNFRESNCMGMLLTLTLQMCSLADESIAKDGRGLLHEIQETTIQWIRRLRVEIHKSDDVEYTQKCSEYAFWAALLCKRTFTLHVRERDMESKFSAADLQDFMECSITLQDNLSSDPNKLPKSAKNALIRDLKLVFRLRDLLRQSFRAHPQTLSLVVDNMWPHAGEGEKRVYSAPQLQGGLDDWWITSYIKSNTLNREQIVRLHLLEGYLLIDHRPIGQLPSEHRQAMTLDRLFGKQNLLTYPSAMHGMTYVVAMPRNGHQIHIGFRENHLIVRARYNGGVFEFIPPEVFDGNGDFDLPASLVENCIHWFNVQTRVLEIRQSPGIWIEKPSNWTLDFRSRSAIRRNSCLIDPRSKIFRQIANIFGDFEHPNRLTVYEPKGNNLTVELKRLEISFFVRANGYLYSKELRSEIDPNQDAGTWYGLLSKLVLRNTQSLQDRSIIVPLGAVSYNSQDLHVAVNVANNGLYGRYSINSTLGRLDCAPEPKLLYLKAFLHACTSFVTPDPLTGRTGTEEALHFMRSSVCRPWRPLELWESENLANIAKLSPSRTYYPSNMRLMQAVVWDPELSVTIQDDALKPAVQVILDVSNALVPFSVNCQPSYLETKDQSPYLMNRADFRRRTYQRSEPNDVCVEDDLVYQSRDCPSSSQQRRNVFETVSILRDSPPRLRCMADLPKKLSRWPTIAGFKTMYENVLLSELLNIDLANDWGALVNLCRFSDRDAIYRLSFLFGPIVFKPDIDMTIIRALLAHYLFDDVRSFEPPQWPLFDNFQFDRNPSSKDLMQQMQQFCDPFEVEESDSAFVLSKTRRRELQRAKEIHEAQLKTECRTVVSFLLLQWPCARPTTENLPSFGSDSLRPLLRVSEAVESILPEWLRLYQNWELSKYLRLVQQALNKRSDREDKMYCALPKYDHTDVVSRQFGTFGSILLSSLFEKAGPVEASNDVTIKLTNEPVARSIQEKSIQITNSGEMQKLEKIVHRFSASTSPIKQRYGSDLTQSLIALREFRNSAKMKGLVALNHDLQASIAGARIIVKEKFAGLRAAFEAGDSRVKWLHNGGLWPCITPISVLEQLRSTQKTTFGDGMKEALVSYAISITHYQRLLRLQQAQFEGNVQKFEEEWANVGHVNWRPLTFPDWLLLEIDGDFVIRPAQVEVAMATIAPALNCNSVLQMNMGQGKTSCIMPMAAADLANSKRLLSLVVPKPLLLQTAQLMQVRLGGLINRQILHVPFSRRTPTNPDTIKAYHRLHSDMKESCGIVITIPEHVLSFKLSGLQRVSDNRINEAKEMVRVQRWMQENCRQILDECDITLAVRTQLIYPSGAQRTIDGHPQRWETIEALLSLAQGNLWDLKNRFPQSVEVFRRPQMDFPIVFFLRKDAEDAFISSLVSDVIKNRIPTLSTQYLCESDLLVLGTFLSQPVMKKKDTEQVHLMFEADPTAIKVAYLLRGLLVHRILLMTLKKRWNVQYGLHPQRDPIAVPFHAKGVPSEQAEWGHPDVAIILTCLAFYFGGLGISQLRQSLGHLFKSNNPAPEYERWTRTTGTLPGTLREYNAVNVDDELQVEEIWKHLRHKVVVIDYFLNHFVFPRHAKQFQIKLQASAWDIPPSLPAKQYSKVKNMTTGFSGTNDNKTLLPLNVTQVDLRGFSHTNAEVLTYLLQDRNRTYVVAKDPWGKRLTEHGLLQLLKEKKIHVLIDAGAQILEMDNKSLAKQWLAIDSQAPAAVYFDVDNKAWVLYRKGLRTPLLASPYADDLSDCLVYLDEAHTRGTDLKMPPKAMGALTLGIGQTKDHTVQAAMRLRKLATEQSIVFMAPPEVHQSILDSRDIKRTGEVESYDVICWLLEQTCKGIEQQQPLHYTQGMDYCYRTQAALENTDFLASENQRRELLKVLRKEEHQKLIQLYGSNSSTKAKIKSSDFSPELKAFVNDLTERRTGFLDSGCAVNASALQEVEQEREVAFEVEEIREVQKPDHFMPLTFPGVHQDIFEFVNNGTPVTNSRAYDPAFKALRSTSLGQKYRITYQHPRSRLFVSREFMRSVKMPGEASADVNFIRPVNWILWSGVSSTALIIIPEEAEGLIPRLRSDNQTRTHLIIYAVPVNRKTLQFNDLNFYSLPKLPADWCAPLWLKIELGILAGRLYFQYDEYDLLCHYLEIDSNNGSRLRDGARALKKETLSKDPLAFLQEWLAVRRKGQDFADTPMGHICQRKILTANHPFFANATAGGDDTLNDKDVAMSSESRPTGEQEVNEGVVEDDGEEDGLDEDSDGNADEVDE